MPRSNALNLPLLLLGMSLMVGCTQQPAPSASRAAAEPEAKAGAAPSAAADQMPNPEVAPAEAAHAQDPSAHHDHESRHGGTFFMALDNKHHLEGVLESPGVFRVYVYDARTRPLPPAILAQVEGKVIWGKQDGAPEIELTPSKDGTVLEAPAPGPVQFPLELTLLARFPGMPATARAEVFTFPFSHFTHAHAEPHPQPAASDDHGGHY